MYVNKYTYPSINDKSHGNILPIHPEFIVNSWRRKRNIWTRRVLFVLTNTLEEA